MKTRLLFFSLFITFLSFGQKTKVEGIVTDQVTGDVMPFVTVRFKNTKIGTLTDTLGHYVLETYYASDSLSFSFSGYLKVNHYVELDRSQIIDVVLPVLSTDIEEVFVRAPDELPSTILHKKVIANKKINNKEKLNSYEYEVYNKIQLDLNNIDSNFQNRQVVKRLDLIMDYLDEEEDGKSYLPVILSESVSDYYYKKTPKKKMEVVKASKISGIENLDLNQFMGDMYLDVNVYDNTLQLFNKSFISPVSNYARSYYRFYLEDSMFIDNYWCYQLKFKPKRTGDITFEGEMWIHDTTYAVKQIQMDIAPWVNINYVQGLYLEQSFDQVEDEVWMLTNERMIADLKITKKTNVYGFYGRRNSSRKNYKINKERPLNFYNSKSTVVVQDSAEMRSDEYWANIRHTPLAKQEQEIDNMVDSLNNLPFFNFLKNGLYLATTGYYPAGYLEVGDIFSLFSFNRVETFRFGLALRTSNKFSKRLELGGKIAYGFGDERFKYGGRIRYNITPKKRGMLSIYYNYDLEQIGQSPTAAAVGSTFGTLFRTGPLDKLTFVEKIGVNLEKDIRKDIILFGGFEWKEYTAVGLANYLRPTTSGIDDTITRIQTTEFTARFRWAKDEEFISGVFDRKTIKTKYPVISIQGIFGVKDLLGADYNYQKVDIFIQQNVHIGALGRLKYGINVGKVFGQSAYPFLKVHAGSQSIWLQNNAFNKMKFFEFISDQYIEATLENHWDGFFFDRLFPFNKTLKFRLVTGAKMSYGSISSRHNQLMRIPAFTKQYGNTPYMEASIGIENIFKLIRVDVVWRLSHLEPGVDVTSIKAFGIRAKYVINF